MAAKSRSPNYPSISLGDAIESMKPVYEKERRARFPRLSLAAHLGYSSLNGRALSKIGALRAYGLIDGREDALSVSKRAIALIEAPKDSEDFLSALHEAFNAPALFSSILTEHGDETPSPQSLRWWLAKQGYVGDAADKALKVYLDSSELVNSIGGGYVQPVATEPPSDEKPAFTSFENVFDSVFRKPPGGGRPAPPQRPGAAQEGLAVGAQERVLQSGLLSKGASYRLIVSGHIGKAEFEKLLAKLNLDRDILVDAPDEDRPDDEDRDPRG